ncbi:MAG: sulfatase-like hydrolase/transferase, partial [Theionarchaea archaeon]|nr:sulfatase-like hydrolase/transferase [Theionarchaea archaeon]
MPNLLFLFTDEQRADTLSAYGNDRISMPNLDALASESVVFENSYVTQPVCTPSRSTLLTGLYPHTNGCTANNIPIQPGTPCLPEMLPKGKYATGYHGKWHLGDEIFAQHGFDDWISIEDGYRKHYGPERDHGAFSTYHAFLSEAGIEPENGEVYGRGQCARLPERLGKPAYLAREATRFIREHHREDFVLFVNFLEPHMPFFGPRDDQYDPDFVNLPENFDDPPADDQPLKTRIFAKSYHDRGHGGFDLRTESDWRRVISNYWGLCSLVDTHVGTILNSLRKYGVYDDTIIVFTSDHGDMMGSHRLLAKCVMFEEALKVPMMVKLPGRTEGARIANPVSQIDLIPTLLDAMEEDAPSSLQGRSLMPLIEGEGEFEPGDVFIEWNGRDTGLSWKSRVAGQESVGLPEGISEERALAAVSDSVRSVVTPDGWKFNFSSLGEYELYNLGNDPFERVNLAGRSDIRPLMEELGERIRNWQKT